MNWELLIVIFAYATLLWNTIVIVATFVAYTNLSYMQQQFAEITLGNNIILFSLSLIGILVYHLG